MPKPPLDGSVDGVTDDGASRALRNPGPSPTARPGSGRHGRRQCLDARATSGDTSEREYIRRRIPDVLPRGASRGAPRGCPAPVAQWIEQRFPKPQVVGSIPTGGAKKDQVDGHLMVGRSGRQPELSIHLSILSFRHRVIVSVGAVVWRSDRVPAWRSSKSPGLRSVVTCRNSKCVATPFCSNE